MGDLANLERLHLNDNHLRGCVPSRLRRQLNMDLSDLGGLPFCGDAPPPPAEREALVALFNAADGPGWANNQNWLNDAPVGTWHGVATDDTGLVSGLDLRDNQLSGELPPELGNLTSLKGLDLRDNQLSGEIPSELGNLTSLDGLNLGENRLTGEIPPELGRLTNLESLGLQENRLSGEIPSELGSLGNLIGLYLHGNRLSGEIPSELGNLANLEWLSEPLREPVKRGDTVGVGQPRQPSTAAPLR